jgi:Arylsulfotransferase (ASST)
MTRLLLLALLACVGCDASDATSSTTEPSLASLTLTGAGTLTPAFSPDIHDYYLSCVAGSNALSIAMTATPGNVSLLVDPVSRSPRSKAAATQTVSVTAQPNDAIVAAAQNPSSKAEAEYWVRCLPPDFPETVAKRHAGGGTLQPGYYLAGALLCSEGLAGYAMILDQHGVPVWYVPEDGGHWVLDVDDVVPGSVSFSFLSSPTLPYANPTPDTPFTVVTPTSPSKTTTLAPTGFIPDNHELQRTKDGHYVMLAARETPGIDLTGLKDPSGKPLGANATIVDCEVVEFEPSGEVLLSWRASEHFDPAKVTTYVDVAYTEKTGTVYDVFHCNSVDVDPANGNYLVSARQMDSVFYVESQAPGTVLWKLGGKPSTKDANTAFVSFPDAHDAFHQQHDARLGKGWEPGCHGGTGRVSVFDDETAPTGAGNARGAVYNVLVGGVGTNGCARDVPDGGAPAPGTAKLVNAYPGKAPSQLGGSVRFYDDGSRVVSWGVTTPPTNQLLTELDEQGRDLLDLEFSARKGDVCSTYRGLKVPVSAFDIEVLRRAVGR